MKIVLCNLPCKQWMWTVCNSIGPTGRQAPNSIYRCWARWSYACGERISAPTTRCRRFRRRIWTRIALVRCTFPAVESNRNRQRTPWCRWRYRRCRRHHYRRPLFFSELLSTGEMRTLVNCYNYYSSSRKLPSSVNRDTIMVRIPTARFHAVYFQFILHVCVNIFGKGGLLNAFLKTLGQWDCIHRSIPCETFRDYLERGAYIFPYLN